MGFRIKPYPFQEDAVAFHIKERYSINAFEMGLGKTVVALSMYERLGLKTLVIVPSFLKQTWLEEIKKFNVDDSLIEVTTYSALKNIKSIEGFDFVVCDECHYLKNEDSLRSQYFDKLLKTTDLKYLLFMSGTPTKNNVGEMWNYVRIISQYRHVQDFTGVMYNKFQFFSTFQFKTSFKIGGRTITKYSGVKNAEALKRMINPFFNRRRVSESELPSVTNSSIYGDQVSFQSELDELLKDFDKVAYMTLKAKAAMVCVADTVRKADEILESGNQVIIFSDHVDSVKNISDQLKLDGFKGSYITGTSRDADRHTKIREFKSGLLSYLVATYKTAGVGHTLTNCNHMILNDLPFVPADLLQAKKRIHRIGQDKPCFYYFIHSSKHFEKISKMIADKNSDISKIYN